MACIRTIAILLMLVFFAQGFHTANEQRQHICAFYSEKSLVNSNGLSSDDAAEDYGSREIEGTADPQHVMCQSSCYTVFNTDPVTNGTKIIKQGCWDPSDKHDCAGAACVSERNHHHKKSNTRFCCCLGDLCNTNITDSFLDDDSEESENLQDTPLKAAHESGRANLVLWMSVLVTFSVGSLVLVALYCFWHGGMHRPQKPEQDSLKLMENGHGPGQGYGQIMGSYTGDKIKFLNVIGQGRYGCVWRATVGEHEVAVKVFPPHYRSYFLNEKDIYCLPFMSECRSLLTYYGCDERPSMDGSPEYLLVLSHSSNGCLQDYLRSNTVDWPTFCRMALSIAKGLAHLHTDMRKGDKEKPCVSHRDLNTRNILVNSDLSCSLCDLGFAMKIVGSKYYQNGEEQHAETKSINDVGTLRYMAPEVLEGAVNLRDCESSLKQIDVYALALVVWELACRCSDLYQMGSEAPPYMMPFESEIGHHPTFEQMQVLVVRHKARPLFPETWKDWTAVRLIRETMEDCWDQDAEARLTALCVEERFLELPALWDRQRSCLFTSGLSPTLNPTQGMPINRGINNSITNNTNSSGDMLRFIVDTTDDTGGSNRSTSKDTQESTVSEGTVETLLTLSPSEPPEYMLNKNWPKGPLQPYQGRNPCMERNLMPTAASEEELSQQESVLVDRSSKHTPQGHFRSGSSCTDTQALVPNDFLNHNQQQQQPQHSQLNTSSNLRPITPIPYVQNVVYNSRPVNVDETSSKNTIFSSWTGGIRKWFESKKKGPHGLKDESWKGNSQEGPDGRLNLLPGRETQVLLNRPTGVITTFLDEDGNKNEPETSQSPVNPVAGSPALRPTTLSLSRTKGHSSGSISKKRLSVECQDLFASSSMDWKLKDPTLRVKTPGDVPASVRRNRGRGFATRFSLYDDRIMGGDPALSNSSQRLDFSELEKDGVLEVCIPSMFSSVPYQINTVSEVKDSLF
ncbi:hypothetical protein FOCC_FOCC001363 [Frankliniella occidentalis]|uniref:receptor protein serine/threonine kinase n=1 Tax=Frankliniella occidentalis TaxID=133901 RepID=A0A6J1S8H0_FRAOC|nr:bone morphogenetic protein receptor type-2 [Frankliniella occidentalis]KAE8751886.1 hypothetical protein FOCC_FOCC001363 [Frankliniella occidentalis]